MSELLANGLKTRLPIATVKALERTSILTKLQNLFPGQKGKAAIDRALQCPTTSGGFNHGKLAKIGDYCLGVIVSLELEDQTTDAGELSVMCAERVSNEALNKLGLAVGLDKVLNITNDTDLLSQKVLATTIEALIAAIWKAYGQDGAQRVWKMLNESQ